MSAALEGGTEGPDLNVSNIKIAITTANAALIENTAISFISSVCSSLWISYKSSVIPKALLNAEYPTLTNIAVISTLLESSNHLVATSEHASIIKG